MKREKFRPAALFVLVPVAVLASFVFSAQTSAVTEEARTLQMIASYRSWGKANVQPIQVPIDLAAVGG